MSLYKMYEINVAELTLINNLPLLQVEFAAINIIHTFSY